MMGCRYAIGGEILKQVFEHGSVRFVLHYFRKDPYHQVASEKLEFASIKQLQGVFQIELSIFVEHEC